MAEDTTVVTPAAPAPTPETPAEVVPTPATPTPAPSQPAEKKKPLSRRERLIFEKNKIEQQLAEEEKAQGLAPAEDDDAPLTVGKYKDIKKAEAKQSALDMAAAITDEAERTEVERILSENIVPSGNPEKDFNLARAAANSAKNAQIATELARKTPPATVPSAPGQPAKTEPAFEPTAQELVFMGPPYNLSKDDIINARNKAEAKGE